MKVKLRYLEEMDIIPVERDSNHQCVAYTDLESYEGDGPDCAKYHGGYSLWDWCDSCKEFYELVLVKRKSG